jgi:predicted nucleotidyltransferase
VAATLGIAPEQVEQFCRKHQIRRLALFGSVLRSDFRSDSDVDVLVDFLPEAKIGFLRLASIQRELSALIGRTVDLRTPQDLSPYFRSDVLRTAITQYAA